VYGLTKGQFSATSEKGVRKKGGDVNEFAEIDLCAIALELGCGFVARSFSGDAKQMVALIRAGIQHQGFALIDCISPCVTFNNLSDSPRGFDWLREHNLRLHDVGFVPEYEAQKVEQEPGKTIRVDMPDGSCISLSALDDSMHDPTDVDAARAVLARDKADKGHVYTGLIYYDPASQPLHEVLALGAAPLALLGEDECRPSRAAFEKILQDYS
jgi:2-oxoglutarate ferredoxin oxidoreductase subunit beta